MPLTMPRCLFASLVAGRSSLIGCSNFPLCIRPTTPIPLTRLLVCWLSASGVAFALESPNLHTLLRTPPKCISSQKESPPDRPAPPRLARTLISLRYKAYPACTHGLHVSGRHIRNSRHTRAMLEPVPPSVLCFFPSNSALSGEPAVRRCPREHGHVRKMLAHAHWLASIPIYAPIQRFAQRIASDKHAWFKLGAGVA